MISLLINHFDISYCGYALFVTCYGPFDALAVIEENRGYEDLLPDTVEIEFKGYKVRILNLKTLVELKKRSRSPEDSQKLSVLIETLRQSNTNESNDS